MYISPWPGITPSDILRRRRTELPYPLNATHRLSFCVARSGIFHLFRALHLQSSETVLMPDYHSGNEVSATLAAGANVIYYPVRRNLEPDLEALYRMARQTNPRVIYVIHFLGWPQPLREIESIAREHGSTIVEDCALSLLSECDGKPLGSTGDYSIFCLYKTLPVPNGGVLVQNRNRLPELANLATEPCPRMASIGRTTELAFEALRSRRDKLGKTLFEAKQSVGRALRRNGVRHVPVGDIDWNPANVNIGMSAVTDRIAGGLDFNRIRAIRRANFERLRELLPDAPLLRRDLPDGVCPLFFPMLVQDKTATAHALQARGISAVQFWNDEHPHAAPRSGPDARLLRRHVLELPIHQDVSATQLAYVAEVVRGMKLQRALQADYAQC
jgi:perosamine synthetase